MPDTPETPPSARRRTQDARRERRIARTRWRRDVLARAAAGESRQAIAKAQNVSLSTVQRALTRARVEIPPENADDFLATQIARLQRAADLADNRIAKGDLGAVYALTTLLPLLERYSDSRRNLQAGDRALGLPRPQSDFDG